MEVKYAMAVCHNFLPRWWNCAVTVQQEFVQLHCQHITLCGGFVDP